MQHPALATYSYSTESYSPNQIIRQMLQRKSLSPKVQLQLFRLKSDIESKERERKKKFTLTVHESVIEPYDHWSSSWIRNKKNMDTIKKRILELKHHLCDAMWISIDTNEIHSYTKNYLHGDENRGKITEGKIREGNFGSCLCTEFRRSFSPPCPLETIRPCAWMCVCWCL